MSSGAPGAPAAAMQRGSSRSFMIVGAVAVGVSTFALIKSVFFRSSPPSRTGPGPSVATGSAAASGVPPRSRSDGGKTTPAVHPEALLAAKHTVVMEPGRVEWRDEQLGVRLVFHPRAVEIEGETRIHPVVRVSLRLRDYSEFRLKFTIEDVGSPITAAEYRDACIERLLELRSYHIISKENLTIGGNVSHPQLYSSEHRFSTLDGDDAAPDANAGASSPLDFSAGSNATTAYFTNVFMARGSTAVIFELEGARDIGGRLPDPFYELIRNFSFFAPQMTTSALHVTEPRLGLGFTVPLGFALQSDAIDHRFNRTAGPSTSAAAGTGGAGGANANRAPKLNVATSSRLPNPAQETSSDGVPPSLTTTCVFANLFDPVAEIHLVAKFDTPHERVSLSTGLAAVTKSVLAAAAVFFGVNVSTAVATEDEISDESSARSLAPVYGSQRRIGGGSNGSNSRARAAAAAPSTTFNEWTGFATSSGDGSRIHLRGRVGHVRGCVADRDPMEDADTFNMMTSGRLTSAAMSSVRDVYVCCIVVGDEIVSFCLCGPPGTSAAGGVGVSAAENFGAPINANCAALLAHVLESLTFGNSHGQETAMTLHSRRSPWPFCLALRPGLRVVEPLLGDPVVFGTFVDVDTRCTLLVRHFPCRPELSRNPRELEAFIRDAVSASGLAAGPLGARVLTYDAALEFQCGIRGAFVEHTTSGLATLRRGESEDVVGAGTTSSAAFPEGGASIAGVDSDTAGPLSLIRPTLLGDGGGETSQPIFTPFLGQDASLDDFDTRLFLSFVVLDTSEEQGLIFQVCCTEAFRDLGMTVLHSIAESFTTLTDRLMLPK